MSDPTTSSITIPSKQYALLLLAASILEMTPSEMVVEALKTYVSSKKDEIAPHLKVVRALFDMLEMPLPVKPLEDSTVSHTVERKPSKSSPGTWRTAVLMVLPIHKGAKIDVQSIIQNVSQLPGFEGLTERHYHGSISSTLSRLINDGVIKRVGRGVYRKL